MTTDAELAEKLYRMNTEDWTVYREQIIAALRRQSQLEAMDAGSRRIIDEMGVELRKAQGRCAKIEEALNLWNAGKITSDAFSYAVDAALAAIKP